MQYVIKGKSSYIVLSKVSKYDAWLYDYLKLSVHFNLGLPLGSFVRYGI